MSDPKSTLAETLLRRTLHAYWRVQRGLTLGVRAAVFDGQGRIFLIRHTYVGGWHLPGGGVEAGESAIEALRRELREEARIELAGVPRLHGILFNTAASIRDHVLVYEVRAFRVIEPKQPDREIAEAGFFSLDGLPEGVTRGTRERLDEIASGRPAPERW